MCALRQWEPRALLGCVLLQAVFGLAVFYLASSGRQIECSQQVR